ncbi:Rv1355c family protein [Pedobacter sp. B4-66]|uniref:Rv1355c family protein n=1 Tax=Pedobacter sp. B4-66 TaxID=2817280 RepID=UPI001BDA24CB|nr:Rv1355c family protein [Pedobacter sp. B4-66]
MLLLENHLVEDTMATEPLFFRIYLKDDKNKLEELLKNKPYISIHDQIDTQLDDLIKSTLPKKKPSQEELEQLKKIHIGNLSMQEYGVWVFYPWSNRLVHLLDEEEFIEVRTNRNIYKITREERDILGKQKIGVVGLSVGQSISITMAMERSFGEIRLADFDVLELTNINRIRTGVHNLGLPKVAIVAREIKEIDPYLKVTCFYDGLTEENMERYFTEGGNLDIVVDECDSLDIKIQLRNVAKPLGIPVVMDTSDRGTLDVERFDLEPDRPILHGLIDHLDYSQVKYLKTNEEKVPFLLAMIGIETVSTRLKASMIEVGQTITTWPQLASAVTLGGALGADVCRRIILDQYHESGRYWVDMSDLIGDKQPRPDQDYNVKEYPAEDLSLDEMEKATEHIDINTVILNDERIKELVSTATLAPSAGNNQPWKWFVSKGKLFLFHDEKHSVSWGDFDNITSNIAFGATIETLKIAAGNSGLLVEPKYFPNSSNKRLVAAFAFQESSQQHDSEMFRAIGLRMTNRKSGTGQKIDDQVISNLKNVKHSDIDVTLDILEDKEQIKTIADIVSKVERVRFLYPQGHYDFYNKEIRWTDEDVNKTKDGLDIRSLELSESDKTGLIVASEPGVIKLLNHWGGGAAFEKLSKNAIVSSSGIGLITMPDYSAKSFVQAGEIVQRVWLKANLEGLAFHPISAPLFLFARLNHGNGKELTDKMAKDLSDLQSALKEIFPILEKKQGVFMFRLSYADEASVKSVRRLLKDTLIFN